MKIFKKTRAIAASSSVFLLATFSSGISFAACSVNSELRQNLIDAWGQNYFQEPASFSDIETNKRKSKLDELFNAAYYLNRYPDLKSAFGNDKNLAFQHWINNGICELRDSSATFSINTYKKYPDLKAAFGDNSWDYVAHFFNNGAAEGRCTVDNSEIPTRITLSHEIVSAEYPSFGTVYQNNLIGGLVTKNTTNHDRGVSIPCTGRLINYQTMKGTVQHIKFAVSGAKSFGGNGFVDHFGVIGFSKVHLSQSNSAYSGYNGAGLIFWGYSTADTGAEGEVFSLNRVNASNGLSLSSTESGGNKANYVESINDNNRYTVDIKIKSDKIKYRIFKNEGLIQIANREFSFSPGVWSNMLSEGLTFFVIGRDGPFSIIVDNISVQWIDENSFN